jgi:hypothetical protein
MVEAHELIKRDLEKVEARREHMRRSMPGTAAIVDHVRSAFPGVKVLWAKEGYMEVGKRQPFDGTDIDKIILHDDLCKQRQKRKRK